MVRISKPVPISSVFRRRGSMMLDGKNIGKQVSHEKKKPWVPYFSHLFIKSWLFNRDLYNDLTIIIPT